ncbi:large ribosomal subunit protein mL53-like isoform X2 [Artemia franciscana]|uniref:large ribosomal subunit protein mL53-like isoform X2 n=1 Tax=Artemia franciscana TaxID=6661 RepID=UPI0032DA020F
MSIPFSGRLTRGPGLLGYISKEVASVSLKPVKKIVFRFDPFREPARPIRDCIYYFSLDKVRKTNQKCIIKTDIVCNKTPPQIDVQLENGKSILFEAENLAVEDILKHFNLIVKPLVPKEEESVIATKGTIAAGQKKKRK